MSRKTDSTLDNQLAALRDTEIPVDFTDQYRQIMDRVAEQPGGFKIPVYKLSFALAMVLTVFIGTSTYLNMSQPLDTDTDAYLASTFVVASDYGDTGYASDTYWDGTF